jgi:hypothetical protein
LDIATSKEKMAEYLNKILSWYNLTAI